MPSLTLNMNALRWNLSQMPRLEQSWNFSFMPVLKMVACHPAVVDAVKQAGYRHYGAAEVDEPLFWKNESTPDTSAPDDRPVLISLPPLHRRNPAGHAQEAKTKLERNGASHHQQASQEN